jgi:4-alpha-glucanotransferase
MSTRFQSRTKEKVALHFSLEYFTKADEYVVISLKDYHRKGAFEESRAVMQSKGDGQWTCDVEMRDDTRQVDFRFSIENGHRIVVEEQRGFFHHWQRDDAQRTEVRLHCYWLEANEHSYIYTSAFMECRSSFKSRLKAKSDEEKGNVVLAVPEFLVPQGQKLLVSGNQQVLGNWQVDAALPLTQTGNYSWQARVGKLTLPLEFKFILRDEETGETRWETGENRRLENVDEAGETVVENLLETLPQATLKQAGAVIPVFSLRSEASWGVGDFGDMKKMLTWLSQVHLHVLQVLPVNDTTRTGSWEDSYPYSGISAFALHPMYADLNALKPLKDKSLVKVFEKERKRLNALPEMDYEGVNRLKNAFLKAYYEQEKTLVLTSNEFHDFLKTQKAWLLPYSYFRCLQHCFGTSDFRCWPRFNRYSETEVADWVKEKNLQEEVNYYLFVQFILFSQLRDVHQYARHKGVILKGDIPIGVSRDSATAWATPEFFNFDSQAGAPPDYFSENGQNWGFPTYNWKNILSDNGRWWSRRLDLMSVYFDAYRIDHVLGFFRIWEIPYEYYTGMLGHFNPALPLSREEISQAGFSEDVENFTVAQFSEEEMTKLFKNCAQTKVKEFFLLSNSGKWQLKDAFLSQRALEAATQADNLREGLMKAVTNVLFLRDKENRNLYHLNIGGKGTFAYLRLKENDRKAYDVLFDNFFYHRHDEFWAKGAREKLCLLTNASRMLPCAEDLGMIPACMRTVLNELRVLSLEVESMPKYSWSTFADVMENPLLSVDTITTHDMAPLRLWWKKNPSKAQEYFHEVLHHDGLASKEMSSELCEEVVRRHLLSPSLLCILALQDWMSIDAEIRSEHIDREQINNPADPHHYWRYRMERSIEELKADKHFQQKIISLLKEAAR